MFLANLQENDAYFDISLAFLDVEKSSTPMTIPIIRIILHHFRTSILFNSKKITIVIENNKDCLKETLIFVKKAKFFVNIHLIEIMNKHNIPDNAKNNVK